MKLLATALFSVTFGILLGLSFPSLWIPKVSLLSLQSFLLLRFFFISCHDVLWRWVYHKTFFVPLLSQVDIQILQLLYKPLISQRYVLCNCLEILLICLHVSRTIWFTFWSDMGSFKSKRSWEITTRYYCIRVRLVFAQVLGEPWRGLILKHAISFLDFTIYFLLSVSSELEKETEISSNIYSGLQTETKHRCMC